MSNHCPQEADEGRITIENDEVMIAPRLSSRKGTKSSSTNEEPATAAALVGLPFRLFNPSEMKWSAQSEVECCPWTVLTNPWGTQFPSVAIALRMLKEEQPEAVTDGLEAALLAKDITSLDWIVLTPEKILGGIENMGLASACMLQDCTKRIVFPLLGLQGKYYSDCRVQKRVLEQSYDCSEDPDTSSGSSGENFRAEGEAGAQE
ncbi:hypothetical protein DXG01_001305 [Tephrocybe rancida]|nr:hypothetical protein DXG01_001305 [Tephrocybe rancida]